MMEVIINVKSKKAKTLMKKFFICLGLAAIMLAPSCENDPTSDILNGSENNTESGIENDVENGEGEAVAYLSVGINNAGTNANTNTNTNTTADSRISVGEENEEGRIPLYWNAGDKLVVNRTIQTLEIGKEFNGKDMAEFGLSAEALSQITYPITLLYPATSMTSSSTKHFYIDTEQEYLQGHLSNGYGILMGKAEKEGDGISMEHMCGYMRVSLTGTATVKKVMLRTVGHEPISGYFKHNETSTEIGMTTYMTSGLADGHYSSPVISINCTEGIKLSGEATDFYFALPAGEYKRGFVLHVLDSKNNQHRVKVYGTGKTITAGVMLKMPALAVNCTKDWGIFDGNELASFGRTLEKNVWLGVDETTIYLRNDIDMENETFTDLPEDKHHRAFITFRTDKGYNNDKIAVIDGKKSEAENYVIYNLRKETTTNSCLLFADVPEGCTVQNITLGKVADNPETVEIEADCILTLKPNGTDYTYSSTFSYLVAGTVKNCISNASAVGTIESGLGFKLSAFTSSSDGSTGTIDGCVNNGSIIVDATNASKENYVGGISAISYGIITNCINRGEIKVTGSNTEDGADIGGVVGCSAAQSTVSNCENYGKISLTGSGSTCSVYMGGVIGYSKSNTPISGCHNYGNVTLPGSKKATYFGGVIGISKSDMSDCHNHAAVTVSNTTSTLHAGGVVGRCDNPMTGCTNEKEVSVTATAVASYIGGIVGTGNQTVTNCTNEGSVSVSAPTAASYIGGIVGTGKQLITSCTNKGNVTLEDATTESYVGGILGNNNYAPVTDDAGNTSSQLLTGCVNGQKDTEKGKITVKYKKAAKANVGGICGYLSQIIQGNSESAEINATNYAPISVDGSATTYVGGIFGYVSKESTIAGYKNCGNIAITNTGSSNYSYCGGISGFSQKEDTHAYCDSSSTITIHSPNGKVRVGGIGGYFAAANNCNSSGNIRVLEGTTASSEVGGMGGFSNNGIKQYCTIDSTIDNKAKGVLIGGLLGSANGSRWYYSCKMKVAITSVDPANTGFASTRAASSGNTIRFGSSGNPFYISKSSTFLGLTASSIDVFSNEPAEDKINFVTTSADYQLSVNRSNIKFVD